MNSIECGSQVFLCDLPIRLDTYKGCSHACSYCFSKAKTDISKVTPLSFQSVKNFIEFKRPALFSWCDWDIPLHWGGMSDPFQPLESEVGVSLKVLELLAETKYPVVISTKGKLVADQKYLDLISAGNNVVQISMVSPAFDVKEKGAPSFYDRLGFLSKVQKKSKRLIIRCQPYIPTLRKEIVTKWLPAYRDAGVYGVIFEGFKAKKLFTGSVKFKGDQCFSIELLRSDFLFLREAAHRLGLKFYSGENRLRSLGDSLTCCGIDGLSGFVPNIANLNHVVNGEIVYREAMKKIATGTCFKTLSQDTGIGKTISKMSYSDLMESLKNSKYNSTIG
jgi:DNA repair photolyase